MSGSTGRPVVLALFTVPELHTRLIHDLTHDHHIGTVVTTSCSEFRERLFSGRGFHAVVMDFGNCELCAKLKDRTDIVGRVPVVMIGTPHHDVAVEADHLLLAIAAGANGFVIRRNGERYHRDVARTIRAAITSARSDSFVSVDGRYVYD